MEQPNNAIEFGVCKLDLRLSGNTWVFDDIDRGLKNEPFVGDTNRIIDALISKGRPGALEPTLCFTSQEPPASVHAEACTLLGRQGNWSVYNAFGLDGPLCPALLKYFPEPPPVIWAWVQ